MLTHVYNQEIKKKYKDTIYYIIIKTNSSLETIEIYYIMNTIKIYTKQINLNYHKCNI